MNCLRPSRHRGGPGGIGLAMCCTMKQAKPTMERQTGPRRSCAGGVTRISGRIGRGLPAYAESAFRSQGVKLDSTYTVIDWKDLQYLQRPFDTQEVIVPLAGGLLLSVVLFPVMVLLRFKVAQIARARK